MKVRRIKDVSESFQKKDTRKKKFKKVLRLLEFLFVAALFVTTIVYAALSPFFNIEKIVVKESDHYTDRELVEASGIREGRNGFRLLFLDKGGFFFLRIGYAEKAIMEKCPYIRTVKAKFVLPSTVSIEVEEREAAAVIITKGVNLLTDQEGYLLEIDPVLKERKLPVIKVPKLETLKPGKKLEISDDMLLSAFKVFDTIEEVDKLQEDKLLPDVDYVDVSDPYNTSFSLQSRIIINLGEVKDLHYKINAAKTIFIKNIKKTDRGKLDFSTDANPVFTPENGG